MTCQGCINRQKRLVAYLCKKTNGRLCAKAQARLQKMLAPTEKT